MAKSQAFGNYRSLINQHVSRGAGLTYVTPSPSSTLFPSNEYPALGPNITDDLPAVFTPSASFTANDYGSGRRIAVDYSSGMASDNSLSADVFYTPVTYDYNMALLAKAVRWSAGADVTEHAIDSYWDLLHSVPFTAFAELEAAGRTDRAIQALLAPAQAEFDRAQAGDHFLKILHAGAGPRFQASRDLARFMLEGLARTTLTYDKDGRKERLLAVIKRATHMLNRKGDVQDLWPE